MLLLSPEDSLVTAIRQASTVLLCRDAEDDFEVFMVVRHHQIDFASGALVFPGGKVEESDADPKLRERCTGETEPEFLPFEIAAIREAFEECGVFLARDAATGDMITGDRLKSFDGYRDALNANTISMLEILEKEKLLLACGDIHRYAHWITPEFMPKRFDTHFFVAEAPPDHLAAHDGSESVDSVWVSPRKVLEEAESGKWTVIFPTRCNLQMMAQSRSVDELMKNATAREIVSVLPKIEQRDADSFLCIPCEAGYPISEEKIDLSKRMQ